MTKALAALLERTQRDREPNQYNNDMRRYNTADRGAGLRNFQKTKRKRSDRWRETHEGQKYGRNYKGEKPND